MQRYNSFNLIHKGLRAMLYDAALTLQQTYFADTNEAAIALEKVEDVLFIFENHAHHEDSFVLPAIDAYEPQIVEQFEQEHEEDLRLSNRLKNLITIYRNIFLPEERVNCGSAISKSFVEFMVFNLEHMAKEEIIINQALWKHYTDEQILALNGKLLTSIPPAEFALATKWMIRGISNFEAVNWLRIVKQSAPSFVVEGLLSTAEKELPAHRYNEIRNYITEQVIAA
jgi:Hemerythrin HHE cation binding domain